MIWRDNEVNPPDPTLAAYICLAYKELTLDEQFLDEVPSGPTKKAPLSAGLELRGRGLAYPALFGRFSFG
jgi:hypothetical protein